jgi:hypothetical protein
VDDAGPLEVPLLLGVREKRDDEDGDKEDARHGG